MAAEGIVLSRRRWEHSEGWEKVEGDKGIERMKDEAIEPAGEW
jgi:hypothetical protein